MVARILVAEDDKHNREFLTLLLEEGGYSVVAVDNGLKAVEAFGREPVDLVLMDIRMPHLDGLQAARRIRSLQPKSGGTPIIGVSAFGSPYDRERFLEEGMDEFLLKPVNEARLLAVIRGFLGRGK